jgi:hypothetical protein
MSGIKKTALFKVPQKERVTALETHVIPWMNQLDPGEQLVVGLPQVLGKWSECDPVIVGRGMQEQFLAWLRKNAKEIEGPIYNLPALNTSFLCMVIDEDFDPRIEIPDNDASQELMGVLISLGNFMTQCDSQAA